MTALDRNKNTSRYDGGIAAPGKLGFLLAASVIAYAGAIAVLDSNGLLAPATTARGLRPIGVFRKKVDNTAGGESAEVDCGVFGPFVNSGSSITAANRGQPCYLVDDQTVHLTDGGATRSWAGTIVDVDSSGVWVAIGLDFLSAGALFARDAYEHAAKGANLADADATILVTQGAWRVLPAATLSAGRTVTLGTAGAVAGDQITVTRLDATANTLAIVNGGVGAGTLVTFPVSKIGFVKAQFDGTNWAVREVGGGI